MTAPRPIPDAVLRDQIAASDPDVSAWVAANAGSGKTHVLAQRVINLLLEGLDPGKILCITFTKAAAANMAARVFNQLAAWTALDDAGLDDAIRKVSNRKPDAALRALARRLFAQALETPGGLKVQTIHAFCTRLLHQFPFEANVAARFEVLDETAQTQLLDRLSLGVLLDAAADPDSALGRALATAITHAADQTFKDVVSEAIGMRDRLQAWTERAGGVDAAVAELARELGIDPADAMAAAEAAILASPIFPPREWRAAIATIAEGSTNDRKQAARLAAAAADAGDERVKAYLSFFFTGNEEPRKQLVTKAVWGPYPELADRLNAEQNRLASLIERRRAITIRDRTAALITVAEAVLSRYRAEKERRGVLDYDDLIEKTLDLLSNVAAAWVHYKLDLGIDHVLIDEAQDTSPKQWEIIRQLVGEFFAGAGARSQVKRTIFAVGDEKQSIFSFQGAAPRMFDAMRREFESVLTAAKLGLRYQRFGHSFRSGPNVLGAVDLVFADEEIYVSVTSDADGISPHVALPDAMPGLVEIWPLLKADERREIEGWDAPFDELAETSPQVRLAENIAATVRAMIDRHEPVGIRRTPARPGDVLVLVRQRGPLFEAIIRALKNAGIAVAGADRLVLTEHIAVMDLIALADALLLPDDDLALACALKSPLFGFDDDDLFALAWGRGKSSLRAALRARAPDKPLFAEAAARLDALADTASRAAPFAFYARVLGPGRGRRKILARLGPEAADALDEFLDHALDYERRETPSLQGFVAWLRTARAEVKRDMEITRNEVRVMTVHGAKGLEAPIVILADTTTRPAGPRHPRLMMLPARGATPGAPDRLVWAVASKNDVPAVAAARERALVAAEDEYRRLLYVAMTRAIDRLIVCGAIGRTEPEGCWYRLVFDALEGKDGFSEEILAGDHKVWRFRKSREEDDGATPSPAQPPEPTPKHAPKWLGQNAPAEPPRPTPVSPSAAYDEQAGRRAVGPESAQVRREALARGLHVHRLLQSLPDIPPKRRAEAARQYLARDAHKLDAKDRVDIAEHVRRVLDDQRFAALFAPGSRAEAPIVGRLAYSDGRPLLVSGQVDRLVVTEREILIADYKANRDPPRSLAETVATHAPYVRQLALYRAVIARIYPDKPVRAALVWTDVPDLMEISAAALDAEMARLTGA